MKGFLRDPVFSEAGKPVPHRIVSNQLYNVYIIYVCCVKTRVVVVTNSTGGTPLLTDSIDAGSWRFSVEACVRSCEVSSRGRSCFDSLTRFQEQHRDQHRDQQSNTACHRLLMVLLQRLRRRRRRRRWHPSAVLPHLARHRLASPPPRTTTSSSCSMPGSGNTRS